MRFIIPLLWYFLSNTPSIFGFVVLLYSGILIYHPGVLGQSKASPESHAIYEILSIPLTFLYLFVILASCGKKILRIWALVLNLIIAISLAGCGAILNGPFIIGIFVFILYIPVFAYNLYKINHSINRGDENSDSEEKN